jgi:ferredoxin-nitrate reductase
VGIKTQCPYCGVGCGLEVFDDCGKWKVMGDATHPSGMGDVCQKPLSLPAVLNIGRVEKPLFRAKKSDEFKEVSWSDALDILADNIRIRNPSELYAYLSGQLLTEESYVFTKLFKGFLGVNNTDANSRLCMASAVSAYKMAFGSDGVPASMDMIESSDGFLFAGSNAAWAHPVLFRRVLSARKSNANAKIVVIDPVCTETARKADLFLQINAGSDTVLFNAVLTVLASSERLDVDFINLKTEGFEEALREAGSILVCEAAHLCGIDEPQIYELADFFYSSKQLLSFWCQGLNQSSNGTAKNLSLINAHLATGRVGVKGAPFSLTGQPNAMGGREVGYLAAGLPGYRAVVNESDRAEIERFWGLKLGSIANKPGPTVVESVKMIEDRQITLFWSVCTNPAVSMPNLHRFCKALSADSVFVVAQEAYHNETTRLANLVLPALQWGEKDGTMTNLERVVTRCERFCAPDFEAKSDWQIACEVAKRLGFRGFSYKNAREIFDEFRQITKSRLCDISRIGWKNLPSQYGSKELYGDKFATPSGLARFNPTKFVKSPYAVNDKYPFVLTSGRTKKQWHTMSRTGKYAPLLKDEEEAYILLCADDAKVLGLDDGDAASVSSPFSKIELKVKIGQIKAGHAFVPFGYGATPTNRLFGDAACPISGQPELKYIPVGINLVTS